MVGRVISRRQAMRQIGMIGAGVLVSGCGDDDGGAAISVPSSCVLTPSQVEGPFFIDTGLVRTDITEGRPGMPLRVELQLVDIDEDCQPIRDAMVEVWHADAEGVYSGFGVDEGNPVDAYGETFLRGLQLSDRSGRIEFQTIYPGWYPVRTTHIHVSAILDGVEQVTTQLYFDQDTNDLVLAEEPYNTRGPQRVRNENDFTSAGRLEDLLFDLTEESGELVASYLIGVSRPV